MRTRALFAMVIALALNFATKPVLAAASWTDAGRFEISVPFADEPGVNAIRGVISKPQGGGPFAAIVMFPGISGFNVHLGNLMRHADHYNSMGIVALAMDPAGSRGYKPSSSPSPAELRRDAYAALRYLRNLAFVGAQQKIFVEGISRGGGVVLAALDGNQNSDQQLRFAGGISYVPWCYPTLASYAPLIIFSGGNDWISSAKQSEQLRGRSNLVPIVLLPGIASSVRSSQ